MMALSTRKWRRR